MWSKGEHTITEWNDLPFSRMKLEHAKILQEQGAYRNCSFVYLARFLCQIGMMILHGCSRLTHARLINARLRAHAVLENS